MNTQSVINAKDAAFLSQKASADEVDIIMMFIKKSASDGKTSLTMKKEISEGAKRTLKNLGYTILELGVLSNRYISW